MEQASLLSGIRIDSQRVVVLPIDMQAARHSEDIGGAVTLACVSACLIFRRIPRVCDFTPFGVQRNFYVIAFIRNDHPETPLFGNNRYPISCEIERCGCTRARW